MNLPKLMDRKQGALKKQLSVIKNFNSTHSSKYFNLSNCLSPCLPAKTQQKLCHEGQRRLLTLISIKCIIYQKAMKEWSKQKTLSQELNPQCCPPNSIVHQISFLNQEIQHLKYQINIIELNLRRVYEFSQKMFCQCSHLSTPNTNDSTDILNLKELGIRITGIESKLRESANRQEFIMHDIEKISNRVLTVESTLQVQFDRESCSMGEIPSANCSESHCEAKFHAQYDRIYHRKHVHNKLDDA